jgi:FtsP/CotA-like multicopper oxidase with cupredoxin domain
MQLLLHETFKENTVNRMILKSLAVTVAVAGSWLQAQSQIRAFQQPPTLKQAPQPGVKSLLLMAPAPGTISQCNPQANVSTDGNIVHVNLDIMRAHFTMFNPATGFDDPVELRSYGGCVTGPTIEVDPGTVLRVDLNNKLSTDDPTCLPTPPAYLHLYPGVGCFNTANLHTHGLHVSPAGNGDNVLINIVPQSTFPYEINIPYDHPAGTFWYHSHRHGSTAMQVASGQSGVLIVRGEREYKMPLPGQKPQQADIDTILHGPDKVPFREQIFGFQQIAYACFLAGAKEPWAKLMTSKGIYDYAASQATGTPPPSATAPWICPPTSEIAHSPGVMENFGLQLFSASIWDTNGRFTSVNGIVQPTVTIKAGEIQRWRFVHEGIHDTINLQIVKSTKPVAGPDLVAASALKGNRLEQAEEVRKECAATASTLVPQFQIAADGLTLVKIHALEGESAPGVEGSNYLQPGYRSDILVVFPSDGHYCLLDQQAPASQRVTTGKNGINGGGSGPNDPQLLAYIDVVGGKVVSGDLQQYVQQALYDGNPQLPPAVRDGLKVGNLEPWAPFTELPPVTDPTAKPQQAAFEIGSKGFTVNGASYKPDFINITRQVNTVDAWELTAPSSKQNPGEPHIYHIHVNPFEVMDVTSDADGTSIFEPGGKCKASVLKDPMQLAVQYCNMWHTFKDTVFVEPGYTVHTHTFYDRYIGEFVLHCHILDHEDAGMMLNINIVPNLNAPGGGLGMSGMQGMSHDH